MLSAGILSLEMAIDEEKTGLCKLDRDSLRTVADTWDRLSFTGKVIASLNVFDRADARSIAAQELLDNPDELRRLREQHREEFQD